MLRGAGVLRSSNPGAAIPKGRRRVATIHADRNARGWDDLRITGTMKRQPEYRCVSNKLLRIMSLRKFVAAQVR
jgi:hypothetical protein